MGFLKRIGRLAVNWFFVFTSPIWAFPLLFAAVIDDAKRGYGRDSFILGKRFFWE